MDTNPTAAELLGREWQRFCTRYGVPVAHRAPVLAEFLAAYGETGREYHGTVHPVVLFGVLHRARKESTAWLLSEDENIVLELGILCHDYVYDPRRKDNEERSALFGEQLALRLGFGQRIAHGVFSVTIATKHTGLPEGNLEQRMVDLDLYPLAVPWPSFVHNSGEIRREYKHLPDDEFVSGCNAFLDSMLPPKRPHIYSTPYFRGKYEAAAQANLRRALSEPFSASG